MSPADAIPETASISWLAKREGNLGWVMEQYSDGTERVFGPMRANIVSAFMSARRTMFELRMRNSGHRKVETE